MNKLPRLGTLVVFGGLVAACSQLIGLDKFDDEEASGGESGDTGTGGKAGKGGSSGAGGSVVAGSGNPTGGQGGSTAGKGGGGGKGGSTGGDSGAAGAEGGTGAEGGDGGTGGDGATGGTGGTTGGTGGTGGTTGGTGGAGGTTGGSAGQGGTAGAGVSGSGGVVVGCSETIEITTTGEVSPILEETYASYVYNVNPQLTPCSGCQGPLPDYLWVDFYTDGEYTGEQTGSFALGVGEEENFASCSRCVLLGVEFAASDAQVFFFAKSGTMVVDSASYQMIGYPNVTLTDVTLEEVTLDDETNLSTPVPGGRCLHLADATVYIPPVPPAEWNCPDAYYFDSDCDCGCGIPDTACLSSLVGACDVCPSEGCAADLACHEVDLDDNAVCSGPQAWTCTPTYYGDSFCDCGCGIVDIDCADATVASCQYCDDADSCTGGSTDDCDTLINPTDNSQCL